MDSHNPYVFGSKSANPLTAKPYRRRIFPAFYENRNVERYIFKKRMSLTKNEIRAPELPGFSHVFNSTSKAPRKVFWALILLSSILLLYFSISSRIRKFSNNQPSKESSTERVDKIYFPAISLCPIVFRDNPTLKRMAMEAVGNTELSSLFRIIDHGTSLDKFWNLTNHYFKVEESQIEKCRSVYEGMSLYKEMQHEITSTPTGICTQLYLDEEIYDSYAENDIRIEVSLLEANQDFSHNCLFLFIHSFKDKPTSKYFIGIKGRRTNFGSHVIMNLKPFLKIRQNRENAKCEDYRKAIQCQMNCITAQLSSKDVHNITCRMPFMPSEVEKHDCYNSTEFESSYKAFAKCFQEFRDWKCDCPKSCKWLDYSVNFLSSNTVRNQSKLFIDVKMNFDLTVDREFWGYTVAGLLSDVGGNMGLFLGVCIVTIVEMFEFIFVKIRNRLQQRTIGS